MNLTEFREGMSRWLEIVQVQEISFPLERYNTDTMAWVVPSKAVSLCISATRLIQQLEKDAERFELAARRDPDQAGLWDVAAKEAREAAKDARRYL